MATPVADLTTAELLGREPESAAIDGLLQEVLRGESHSLVVRGPPGIGKTALLGHAAAHAVGAGITVLRTVGSEPESDLAFAGLYGLVRPVLDKIDQLPHAQAAALRTALGLAQSPRSDRFIISVATLGLIAATAEGGPLLCLVDDAQWLDVASADALLFAARRLQAEPVAMIFAARDGDVHSFAAPGLPDVILGGISDEAAKTLLLGAAPGVSESVRDRVLTQAQGNPLALLELPRGLSDLQRRGLTELPEPFQLTSRLQSAFTQRIERLPDETRAALLLAAIGDDVDADAILRAAQTAGLPDDAIDPAEAAGLIHFDEGRIAFRHPLVRSALQGSMTASQTRRAHAALAAALTDAQHADRRLWHQAMATLTADENLAAELEASGLRSQQRGAHSSAVTAFTRAAALTTDDDRRADRLAAAAEAAWTAGDADRARKEIARSIPLSTGNQRGRLLHLRGVIEARTGELRTAVATLVDAVDKLADGGDDGRSFVLEVLMEATAAAVYAGEMERAAGLAGRARMVAPHDTLDVFRVSALGAVAAYFAGDYRAAAPLLADAILCAAPIENPIPLIWAADFAAMANRLDDRLKYATLAVDIARDRALVSVLPLALQKQASALIGHGRFSLAYAAAEEGIRLASDSGHHWGVSWNLANLAMISALRGHEVETRAHVDEIVCLVALSGATMLTSFAEWAVGLLHLTLGRPDDATDHLLLLTAAERPPVHPYIALGSIPDLIEAATRAGRQDEIAERLDRYANWVHCAPSPTGASLLARCRALTGHGDPRSHFEAALAYTHELSQFEQARTELQYGEWLRRQREPREARAHLRKASDSFRHMSASPWQQRADAELRATGERTRRREPSTLDRLTPQELQIATLVAAGMTNRQIAAQLYLSPRTIDYHLRKVFTKLAVASRGELAHVGLHQAEPV